MSYSNWQQSSGWSSVDDPTGILGSKVLHAHAGLDTNNEDYLIQEIGTTTAWSDNHYSARYRYAVLDQDDVESGSFGIVARASSISGTPTRAQSCYIGILDKKGSKVSIIRRVSGSDTTIASASLGRTGVGVGVAYTLRFDVFGTNTVTLQLYIDDELVLTTTDQTTSKLASGFSGIYCKSAAIFISEYYVYKYTVTGESATGWTPSDLGSKVLWFKSDAEATTSSGALVDWGDQSGNNNDMTLSGSAADYTTNVLNSYPVVGFTNTSSGTITHSSTLNLNSTGLTFGMVINVDPELSGMGCVIGKGAVGSETYKIDVSSANDRVEFLGTTSTAGSSNVASTNNSLEPSGYRIVVFVTNKDGTTGVSDKYGFFIDGSNADTIASGTSFGVNTDTSTNVYVGDDPSNNHLIAKMPEMLLVGSEIGQTDRQKLEGYLAHKYALTSVLPAGHPFKTVAP